MYTFVDRSSIFGGLNVVAPARPSGCATAGTCTPIAARSLSPAADAAYDEGRARRASAVVHRAAHVADDPAASTDDTPAKRAWRRRHVHNPPGTPRIRRDDAIATLFANTLITGIS
jgi:hypothetical protein